MASSSSTSRALRDLTNKKINEIDKTIDDVAKAMLDIADTTARSELEARLLMVKLKRERVKAITAIAKSEKVLADMEVLIAQNELGLELDNMKRKNSDAKISPPAAKKIKMSDDKSSGTSKHKSDDRSSTKRHLASMSSHKPSKDVPKLEEAQTLLPRSSTPLSQSTKTSRANNKKKSSKPACKTTISTKDSKSLPKRSGKNTILLSNPPVRDVPVMANNVGYFTTEYANEVLGYVPRDLSECNKAMCICSPTDNDINQKNTESQAQKNMLRAYNLNVTPGYNLSLLPGYLLTESQMNNNRVYGNQKCSSFQQPTGFNQRPKFFNLSTAVNQHPTIYNAKPSSNIDAQEASKSRLATGQPLSQPVVVLNPLTLSGGQHQNSGDQSEVESKVESTIVEASTQNDRVTNKLFKEIRNAKNVKEEDVQSLSSIDTLVIYTA